MNDEQLNEEKEYRLKEFQLAQAYEDVFGREGARNQTQQKVWEDLELRCNFKRNTVLAGRDGSIDPYATHLREGCRTVFLKILANLDLAREGMDPEQKVTVTK